ncbi:MAG: CRISPR-associated endoribonuclease Cas6 [Paludibacter sp.]|nr:CRISPR-associated endoribonuclease Cas6 [Paludibacter sp.]
MRFKLSLTVEKDTYGNALPINYQYELSSFVYTAINRSNARYSTWLHQNGFAVDNKYFRLFTFSNLLIPKYRITGDRLIIESSSTDWEIAFLPEQSTEEFIKGIFSEQVFTIGDRQSKVQFRVAGIELMSEPAFGDAAVFSTLSPVCITRHEPDSGRVIYESPDSQYARNALLMNLKNKYAAFHGHEFTGDDTFEFTLLSSPASKLVSIKTGTPQQSKVRGYTFRFKLKADRKLLQVMYHSGLGEKNAMGFGCVKY